MKTEDISIWILIQRKSLELIKNLNNESYGTLQWLLDDTKSAMGGRLLRHWIEKTSGQSRKD